MTNPVKPYVATPAVAAPRIAIPVPHSQKDQYNRHSLPLYKLAIERFGAEPVEVPLGSTPEEIAKLASTCQGVLGICYGLQSLNVWRTGTLLQHIVSKDVDHEAGAKVPVAHTVMVKPDSKLAKIMGGADDLNFLPVNSSHHQSASTVGDGLRSVAESEDHIVEAIEGTDPEHWVVGVQWHPERTMETEASSRQLFESFVDAARKYAPKGLKSE
jgi:putative glutamine amidotransferase